MATAYDTWKTHDEEGEREFARETAIEPIVEAFQKDPKRLAEAEEWTAGGHSEEHYSAVSLALHALHNTDPDKLLGSELLVTLYRLAKVDHRAIEDRIRIMAEDEYERRLEADQAMRDEPRQTGPEE